MNNAMEQMLVRLLAQFVPKETLELLAPDKIKEVMALAQQKIDAYEALLTDMHRRTVNIERDVNLLKIMIGQSNEITEFQLFTLDDDGKLQ